MTPGELLHVPAGRAPVSHIALDEDPAHRLALDDLRPQAAASQQPG